MLRYERKEPSLHNSYQKRTKLFYSICNFWLSNEVLLFKGIYKHSTAGVPALLEKDLAEATRPLKKYNKKDKTPSDHYSHNWKKRVQPSSIFWGETQ
jgi:hypothetical protein